MHVIFWKGENQINKYCVKLVEHAEKIDRTHEGFEGGRIL